jgi:hypothetical protein
MSALKEKIRTLETEVTSFLLLVAGLFFLLEGTIHYANFFVTAHVTNIYVPLTLFVGSIAVGAIYLFLAYKTWRNPVSETLMVLATLFSGFLSVSYFIIAIIESTTAQSFFSPFFNYIQFLVGYGSVTILVELLIVFFSWRAYRALLS